MPLPSLRTIHRSLEDIDFASGILEKISGVMRTKVSAMKETERECCITLDEMKIDQKIDWDRKLDKLVTLPSHLCKADHALVFMLEGTSIR